ncbi:MAG: 5-oxoprolinase subunit PxpB [Chloroflexi bacterium]|nr:5-oxoprolinase subunit PxpB [Chloroflexota bacterium]
MAEARPVGPTEAPVVSAFGDSAVRITIAGPLGLVTSARVHATAAAVSSATAGRPGWGRPVAGATSVLVTVDPLEPGAEAAAELLHQIVAGVPPVDDWPAPRPPIEIPTRYGGADGPDLQTVAALTGLTPATVVEAHAGVPYRALFLGFAPGFAYLGVLPPALVVPRRAEPRVRVPAGSVALAGEQTAVFPLESPGGWHLIGRTSATLWDPPTVAS